MRLHLLLDLEQPVVELMQRELPSNPFSCMLTMMVSLVANTIMRVLPRAMHPALVVSLPLLEMKHFVFIVVLAG